eukprot:438679_1
MSASLNTQPEHYVQKGYIQLPIVLFALVTLIPIFHLIQKIYIPKKWTKRCMKHIINIKYLSDSVQKNNDEVPSDTNKPNTSMASFSKSKSKTHSLENEKSKSKSNESSANHQHQQTQNQNNNEVKIW